MSSYAVEQDRLLALSLDPLSLSLSRIVCGVPSCLCRCSPATRVVKRRMTMTMLPLMRMSMLSPAMTMMLVRMKPEAAQRIHNIRNHNYHET